MEENAHVVESGSCTVSGRACPPFWARSTYRQFLASQRRAHAARCLTAKYSPSPVGPQPTWIVAGRNARFRRRPRTTAALGSSSRKLISWGDLGKTGGNVVPNGRVTQGSPRIIPTARIGNRRELQSQVGDALRPSDLLETGQLFVTIELTETHLMRVRLHERWIKTRLCQMENKQCRRYSLTDG